MIRFWSVETGREERRIPGAPAHIEALAFSPDGRLLSAAERRGPVLVWDIAKDSGPRSHSGHRGSAAVLAFSPDSQLLATGGRDGTVLVWDESR